MLGRFLSLRRAEALLKHLQHKQLDVCVTIKSAGGCVTITTPRVEIWACHGIRPWYVVRVPQKGWSRTVARTDSMKAVLAVVDAILASANE